VGLSINLAMHVMLSYSVGTSTTSTVCAFNLVPPLHQSVARSRIANLSIGQHHSPATSTLFMSMGEMEEVEVDVCIVGGGPAGCTCALYTSRADLSTIILDKNPAVGALAITSHIANYPGVDRSMSGAELLQQMKTQAIEYGTRVEERAQVFMIDFQEESESEYNKLVYTPDVLVKARSLVLATGAMGRSLPPFPGEEKYLGSGVSYCATCDGAFYRDAEVAVYGATGEAMEEALFLTKFASTVHWVTPLDVILMMEKITTMKEKVELNALFDPEVLKDLLAKPNVKHWNKTKMKSVEGGVSGVTGVTVQPVGSGTEETTIPVEGAFIYGAGGGSKPITDFCQGKVELDDSGGVVVNEDMETTRKGVFAIGDIRNTPYKQVVVAAADGCIAAMSIEKFLKGRKVIKVDWVHR
jgi:thioredoxin reductase (NADPH)